MKIERIRNFVFGLLILIFAVLVCGIFGLNRRLGIGHFSFSALISLAAVFFVSAVVQIILTTKIKESKLKKTFYILAGASAAAIPICVILHNVVYGLFFHEKDGDEAFFFILALIVCPGLFILSSLGSIAAGISDRFRKKEIGSSI